MSAIKEKLDVVERGRFKKLETIVAEGMASFVVVGSALKEIRDAKLYRESHKTFDKYVSDKWGFERSRAYQLIDASETNQKMSTIVDKSFRASEIKNEGQLRELKDVPVESLEAVVNKAAEISGDRPITATSIKQAKSEVLPTAQTVDAVEYFDVDDTPEPEQAAPKETKAEQASKLKAGIKSHNAAMMRMIDELQELTPNKACHANAHAAFRSIHTAMESWK